MTEQIIEVANDAVEELSDEERAARIQKLNEWLWERELGGHWEEHVRAAPLEPVVWHWGDIYEGLMRSGEDVRLGDDTLRRTVQLINPATRGTAYRGTSRTIQMSVQLVKPGERAGTHRHTAEAIRFIVQGHGAFTAVEGERMLMEPNDLIVTPGWSWHDHANLTDEPAVWLDGLDLQLASHLNAMAGEMYSKPAQEITKPDDASKRALGAVRATGPGAQKWAYPAYRYAWADTLPVLEQMEAAADHPADSPYDGVVLEYVNPLTGGHLMQVIGCKVQLLRPGQVTQSHRHTGTTIYHVVEGRGRAVVDGTAREFGPKDCFIVPPWRHHNFENASNGERVIMFTMSDIPAVEALGLYREEASV